MAGAQQGHSVEKKTDTKQGHDSAPESGKEQKVLVAHLRVGRIRECAPNPVLSKHFAEFARDIARGVRNLAIEPSASAPSAIIVMISIMSAPVTRF